MDLILSTNPLIREYLFEEARIAKIQKQKENSSVNLKQLRSNLLKLMI